MTKMLKNKNILFSLIAGFFAIILLFSTYLGTNCVGKNTNAEENNSQSLQTNQEFTISMLDRKTGKESTNFTQEHLSFGNSFIYQWSEISGIKFNYNPEIATPPIKYQDATKPETEYYDLSISIEYIQRYKDIAIFYQNGYINLEGAYTATTMGVDSYHNLKNSTTKFLFNVDEGKNASLDGKTVRIKDWGIYRFKLLINGEETYSDFFILEPTIAIKDEPTTVFYTTSSTTSLHNDYVFSVANLDKYQYIDASKLIWYVRGKSEDGVLYALTTQDLSHNQFIGNAFIPLYPDYNNESRSGLSFRFDDRGISGSWEVWCEYNYYQSTEDALVSKITVIDTGSQMNYVIIIGIVAGIFVLAICFTIIFAARRAKKDKVY